ncbi:MAG: tyrosine-type recombinase/integrase [Bdellovibrionaceae bacterium]|nr:tyrosine-type recombinase/integrase [Pseudobdellovibrionaceae bacterium]
MRHSFATHLLENNVNLRHTQYLLGHANIRHTVRYSHIADIKSINVTSPIDSLPKGGSDDK